MIRNYKDIGSYYMSKLCSRIKSHIFKQEKSEGIFDDYIILNNFTSDDDEPNLFVVFVWQISKQNDVLIEIVYIKSFATMTDECLDIILKIKNINAKENEKNHNRVGGHKKNNRVELFKRE